MNTKWLKKFNKEGRAIKMSAREKRRMLFKVLGPMNVPSPYYFVSTFIAQYNRQFATVALALIFILTSGGTSYAAESALPGDPLYSIKVNVNEEIQNFVALTPDAKAKVAVIRTTKRLQEAEDLSKKGKLTVETQAIIETKIAEHADAIKANIAALASENATATVAAVISDLKTSVAGHEANLSIIASSTAATSTDARIDSILSKVKTEINSLDDSKDATSTTATSTLPSKTTDPAITDPEASSTATTTIEIEINTTSSTTTVVASTTLQTNATTTFKRLFLKKVAQ